MSDRLQELDRLLQEMTDDEVMKAWAKCMRHLRVRGLVRTSNTPVGDYAERICCERFGLERKGFSENQIASSDGHFGQPAADWPLPNVPDDPLTRGENPADICVDARSLRLAT